MNKRGIPTTSHYYSLTLVLPNPWLYYLGVSKNAVSVALILVGCLEVPARIANGYLADKKIMSTTEQYMICALITGVTSLLSCLIPGLSG